MRPVYISCMFCLCATAMAFDATPSYVQTNVVGFKVYVSRDFEEHPAELEQVRAEIEQQVQACKSAVDPTVFSFLTSVPIWLEWKHKTNGAAEYHPSKEWLVENGYNPKKAQCIEINNARNFLKWSRHDQPSMLLHELAHAFHDQVLGWDDKEITAAFESARDSHKYESVPHVSGKMRRAYALTDHKEYFAELAEAYFGKNDFYPFTRSELKDFDPAGYAAVENAFHHSPAGRVRR